MRIKKLTGIVVAVIGVVLIAYSAYSMHNIAKAKSEVESMSKNMSYDVVGKRVSGSMMDSASQYDSQVMIGLFAGIALAVVGGTFIFFCKKKKK